MSAIVSPKWNTHGTCGWCGTPCWCAKCHRQTASKFTNLIDRWRFNHMLLCPDCGNKRCPKATNHTNTCTGSNEPGQPGSAYQ